MADIGVMTRNTTRSKRLAKRKTEVVDQLLPGVPDDITIDLIAPKLPWVDCQKLSSVSRGWQRVIQSSQIYDARVRAQSTQAFVVINHGRIDNRAISVYSPSDKSCYKLPPIPWHKEKIPLDSRCISLDNKVYLLGGMNRSRSRTIAEVHVLDLAEQRQWKQCASMSDCRAGFGCGVMNGKIYVFGGFCICEPIPGCEVYDPDTDAWSPIARMKAFRNDEMATALGEEFFVIGWESSLIRRECSVECRQRCIIQ